MPFIVLMIIAGVLGFLVLLAFMSVLRITPCPTGKCNRLFAKTMRNQDVEIREFWCEGCRSFFMSTTNKDTGEEKKYPIKENVPRPPWADQCF